MGSRSLARRIPGVKDLSARAILSEIGIDMSRFVTDAHLISWACLRPRSDESAGKRRSNRIRKGSPWLKTTLVQCAWAAARTKGSYLQAQFHASDLGVASRRRSWPLPLPSSPPSITCLTPEPCIRTSAPTTSIAAPRSGRKTAWFNVWKVQPYITDKCSPCSASPRVAGIARGARGAAEATASSCIIGPEGVLPQSSNRAHDG
jgi:Transposase IS116/IS110/IS902 family